jgi:hypothetical protein
MTTGAWLGEMGFEQGDQVTLTNPKQGMLVILDTLPADIWYPQKQRKRLEARIVRLKKELAEAHWESEVNSSRHALKMAELDLQALYALKNIRA